jgi:hypothetical protein
MKARLCGTYVILCNTVGGVSRCQQSNVILKKLDHRNLEFVSPKCAHRLARHFAPHFHFIHISLHTPKIHIFAQHAITLPEIAQPYAYVRCLASSVCHPTPAVCFLRSLVKLSSVCCLPPTACFELSSFCRFSLIGIVCSLFCCLPSDVSCLLPAFCFLLSEICYRLSAIL